MPVLKRLRILKGKRIGYVPGTMHEILLRETLTRNGLSPHQLRPDRSTGPGCVHLGVANLHKVGAIGLPGFDWETAIVDENLKPVTKGDAGELIIRGAGVMQCYYRNPEATKESIKDGWLLTGDVAREDEDGFIWLVDRKKDVIITGGENIYPVEIEDHLQAHSKIQDVAVIGIPDKRLGERFPLPLFK